MSVRKLVLAVLLIISVCLCYTTAVNGLSLGDFTVSSYEEIEKQNKELETSISDLTRKTTTDYDSKKSAVTKAIKEYNDAKEEYEALAPTVASLSKEAEVIELGTKPYDIEYLLVKIGEYATREGLTITFNVVKSAVQGLANIGAGDTEYYTMADINFKVLGEYNSIIEFLYHIEDDDELNFEIKDFKMGPSSSNVEAEFNVNGIPINTKNLSNLNSAAAATDSTGVDPNNPLNIDSNSVNKNLISDDVKASAGANTTTDSTATP